MIESALFKGYNAPCLAIQALKMRILEPETLEDTIILTIDHRRESVARYGQLETHGKTPLEALKKLEEQVKNEQTEIPHRRAP